MSSGIDLSTLMSITVHDIKNDINHLIGKVERIELDQSIQARTLPELGEIKTDAIHINNQLVQLLALYKADEGLLKPYINQHGFSEFLDEKCAQHQRFANTQGKTLSVHCDDTLFAFFDESLISSVVDSALENALRYAKTSVQLRAEHLAPYHIIYIEDDGPGYPQDLIQQPVQSKSIDQESKHTGLGLYFAQSILNLHSNREHKGYFELGKSAKLGGARFSIFLP